MHKARSEAIRSGQKTYTLDTLCRRGHYGERYTSNGGCVVCVKAAATAQQDAIAQAVAEGRPDMAAKLRRKVAQETMLKAGGARTADEARSVGLEWFKRRTDCGHCIVTLDGFTCQLCGHVSPNGKKALDLLS